MYYIEELQEQVISWMFRIYSDHGVIYIDIGMIKDLYTTNQPPLVWLPGS